MCYALFHGHLTTWRIKLDSHLSTLLTLSVPLGPDKVITFDFGLCCWGHHLYHKWTHKWTHLDTGFSHMWLQGRHTRLEWAVTQQSWLFLDKEYLFGHHHTGKGTWGQIESQEMQSWETRKSQGRIVPKAFKRMYPYKPTSWFWTSGFRAGW